VSTLLGPPGSGDALIVGYRRPTGACRGAPYGQAVCGIDSKKEISSLATGSGATIGA
jgi:hypothetical protein